MRIIARFKKGEAVRFVSHLDVQRLFQRAFRRAKIPMAFSQGFNPHPVLAFATALSVGASSEAEWLDIKLAEAMQPEEFLKRVNDALPESGFKILEAKCVEDNYPALSSCMCAASYTVMTNADNLKKAMEELTSGPILVEKMGKGGLKTVDIGPMLYEYQVLGGILKLTGRLDAAGSFNVDLFLKALKGVTGEFEYLVHRECIWGFEDGDCLPAWRGRRL